VVVISVVLVGGCSSNPAQVSSAGSGSSSPSSGSPGSSTSGAPSTAAAVPGDQVGNGKPVTIAFGGDIHYSGPLAQRLATAPTTMLAGVRSVIDSADLTIVNLETSIGSGGAKATKAFNFQAPPAALGALTSQGVDVIGMANNHALDYGASGLTQTLDAIAAAKAPVIGIGHNEDEAFRPFTATIRGQRISVIDATQVIDASLVTAWTATATHAGVASAKLVDRLLTAVRSARATSNTVVVFLHWGTETTHCPNAAQAALAPELVDAGADLVVGAHAHRIQGGGYLGHAYVEYGLGNLQFVGGGSFDSRDGGMLTVTATGRRITEPTWHPVVISGSGLPTLRTGPDQQAGLGRWAALRSCAKLAATPSPAP
jgi:poly-gamma-glutamate synthesis protein (capsule biosynthesis protein)